MEQTELDNIIKAFSEGTLPEQGVISLYGSFLGKPGDTISLIKDIKGKSSKLIIELGKETITILYPLGIHFTSFIIEVNHAQQVLLDKTLVQPQKNEKAFMLYTW